MRHSPLLHHWRTTFKTGHSPKKTDTISYFIKARLMSLTTDLWQEILQNLHNHEMVGRPRELGTYNAVRQHYWWPGQRTFVKNYVQGCRTCQWFKINCSPAKPAYIPTEGAKYLQPFANCSIDLITDPSTGRRMWFHLGCGRPSREYHVTLGYPGPTCTCTPQTLPSVLWVGVCQVGVRCFTVLAGPWHMCDSSHGNNMWCHSSV